jgi:hypothetical protein
VIIRHFRSLFFVAAGLVCLPGLGSATLIVNGPIVNTPLSFHANLTWTNPSAFDSLDLGNAPWDVDVFASGQGQFALTIAQHAFAPNPGDAQFGGNLQIIIQAITPGVGGGTFTDTALHPASDFDKLTVRITPDVPGQSSTIDISADHELVPEPGTLGLGAASGAILLILRRRRVC